ncbi:EAL domain-containing protein [Vibrio europaeus]|uniref:EAL domain-containing protein n=1 Tax=Vibrio europaeus TaxID=300876 RepID=A0A178J8S0_9VIBR|nr:EAL domain-containing protein [Vibrio europaeus]MDC5704899.1 EAL domain-containing protein [Vibrio europaeus]MDC5710178.1 EAL domain-containing protein [Vibrio europaeus]MDC5715268.1 EAL domain-containing protein [Vibrio europaeus]MDC5718878.1 EAL domain-containing protein [Vibrio europaeus]MDC5724683.1 EAL domain-containing protein [Vibrio europaeus]
MNENVIYPFAIPKETNRLFHDKLHAKLNASRVLLRQGEDLRAYQHIKELQQSGEFILYYQPQMNIEKNCITSLEALIRHKASTGVITPPTFLQSFAKLGLIPEVDTWVIKRALQEVSSLALNPEFKVSINVSPQTFLIKGFADTVLSMIIQSNLQYHQVELEITEDVLIQDENQMRKVFTQLKRAGVSIALDDFGAGYSSIGNLINYEYDKVKIDRSLVTNIGHKNGREMFRLTTDLVRLSGAEITVEGVETIEELDFISSLGIESIQGYYFYKPMPFDQVCSQLSFCK